MNASHIECPGRIYVCLCLPICVCVYQCKVARVLVCGLGLVTVPLSRSV